MTTRAPATAHGDDPGHASLLAVACPGCHAAVAAPREWAGSAARCPLCHEGFTVPSPPSQKRSRGERSGDEHQAADDRRLARDEKATRRARRNIARLVAGVVILIVIVLVLGRRRPKKRR